MTGEKFTIGAIGVGPVGSILSVCLAEAGAEIFVADMPHRIEQVQKNGLQVRWGEKMLTHHVNTVDSIRWLAKTNPDCIIIATKAGILKKILPEVKDAVVEDCLVISAQNGIGPEDEIARFVPANNVCRMVVNYAGANDDKGLTHVGWFNPPNYFGLLTENENPKLIQFLQLINSAGLTSELVDTITVKKNAFFKTILNSSLLPLCAIMTLTMKEAMTGKATRRIAGDLVREGLAVAERLGYDYGEDIWQRGMGYLDKGGDHHPSMTGDLNNKVPTEIDFINGKILEIGQAFDDLDLEVNRILVSMIMTQEVRDGTRTPEEIPDYLGEIL